ncbi:C4-dicarboxylate ABC transporter substrate-binding protein [Bacterioplanes sanyensis]|uniref:TRAP transporter substrate-binding protein n=1 Tax=Bacterioplanes sanyensis TaxID=1249553 RepID=UPI00167C04A9|nr:TRAP transporter substrate-binding protein DctP [Bacterioplanes sanyensis]GGY52016.1 C4-dicarboxylate ABC transporter substrate-binding protein [Bacterioplanes sanyensis]
MIRLIALMSVLLALPLSAQATTLKIATLAPDGTSWMKEMRAAAKEIKQQTEGRVKIKYFPGGVQGSDKSVLRKIRIRQLQGGAIAAGALASIAKETQLYSLPFTFRNLEEVRAVREEFDPIITKALEKKGFVLLGLSEGGFAYLMSDQPLHTSDDVRQQKVWVPEGDIISKTTFENGDVQPIALPVSDVYTSLQTGLVDTIAANMTSAIALQWHTKLTHVTDFPLTFLMGTLVVDAKAFNKINADDQAVVRSVMAQAFANMDQQNEQNEAKARAALAQNGMQFVELSAEDKQAWYQLAKRTINELADQAVYPVDEYQQLQHLLQQVRQQTAATP